MSKIKSLNLKVAKLGGVMAAITLGISVMAVAAESAPGALRAGAAKGNITPNLGVPIIGGFRPFPAKHVHDDLWVKCLVLDNGETRVAFVVCDLLGISRGVSDVARQRIEKETGLPASHVLVSAVHTHSAPRALGGRYDLGSDLDDYQQLVAGRIADAVRCAINNLEPAQIGWATASEPNHVFCRRWILKPGTMPVNPFGSTNDIVKMNPKNATPDLDKPAGPVDPEISMIAVRTRAGKPLALLANYSLHYVGGVTGAAISADYYGMFDDRMRELLNADHQEPRFIAIMSNGTSGNINNVDYSKPRLKRRPYERMREVANDVAQATYAAYQNIKWHDSVPLAATFEEIELGFRHPTPEQLERAKEVLAKLGPDVQPKSLEEIYAARVVEIDRTAPEHWQFALQSFRVGDVGIATLPTEVFSEIGLEIKERSPFKQTFAVSLAHGYFGYLPTVEQLKLGGYETWLGTNRLEAEAAPKMIEQLLAMLARMHKEK